MAPSEARRNQWGQYLVVPPGGPKPIGYTRSTVAAKTLDDQGGLMPWNAAMAMTGLMRSPGKRASLEALVSAHPEKGPWYGGDESKKAIKKLVEECKELGGSTDRADIGTALHAIIEQIGRGNPVTISQDSTRADVDAYRALIAEHGIEFVPEYIEATFVLDDWRVAGTADGGAVRIPALGTTPVIADLKTGTNLDYSGQAIAVQLATYANGDAHYIQGNNPDGSEDQRLPMPELRKDIAVVIHLPAGEARAQLYKVDIAAGMEAFERSMWARQWRKRKDLLVPLELEPIEAPRVAGDEPVSAMDATRLTLLELIKALSAERQAEVKAAWPSTLPPLKNPAHWTPALLVECTQFVAKVASGAHAVDTGSADPPSVESVSAPDADDEYSDEEAARTMPASAFLELPPEEQTYRMDRGHLPAELRATPDVLAGLRQDVEVLDERRRAWVETHAQIAELPSLGHPDRWSKVRAGTLRAILDTVTQLTDEQLAPPDWPALCKANGITKAAAGREAKRLAAELGIKVPAKVDDLPTDGVFAVQFANWIELTAATKASEAAAA